MANSIHRAIVLIAAFFVGLLMTGTLRVRRGELQFQRSNSRAAKASSRLRSTACRRHVLLQSTRSRGPISLTSTPPTASRSPGIIRRSRARIWSITNVSPRHLDVVRRHQWLRLLAAQGPRRAGRFRRTAARRPRQGIVRRSQSVSRPSRTRPKSFATKRLGTRFSSRPAGYLLTVGLDVHCGPRICISATRKKWASAFAWRRRFASETKAEGDLPPGNGTILDSEGRKNEDEIWGNSADWCDYSGTIDGQHVGMTIFCHPDNFRPSWFHARDYGFLAANPFGRNAFGKGEKSRSSSSRARSLRLRYGMLIHSGPKEQPARSRRRISRLSCSKPESNARCQSAAISTSHGTLAKSPAWRCLLAAFLGLGVRRLRAGPDAGRARPRSRRVCLAPKH